MRYVGCILLSQQQPVELKMEYFQTQWEPPCILTPHSVVSELKHGCFSYPEQAEKGVGVSLCTGCYLVALAQLNYQRVVHHCSKTSTALGLHTGARGAAKVLKVTAVALGNSKWWKLWERILSPQSVTALIWQMLSEDLWRSNSHTFIPCGQVLIYILGSVVV